jgi:hypothetical protein
MRERALSLRVTVHEGDAELPGGREVVLVNVVERIGQLGQYSAVDLGAVLDLDGNGLRVVTMGKGDGDEVASLERGLLRRLAFKPLKGHESADELAVQRPGPDLAEVAFAG